MSTIEIQKSRYRIEPNQQGGFTLDGGDDRCRVCVRLKRAYWEVGLEGSHDFSSLSYFSLVQTRHVIDTITRLTLSGLRMKNGAEAPYRFRNWMIQKTTGSIVKAVLPTMEEIRSDHADQKIVDIQRKVFAANFSVSGLLMNPHFYEVADRFLLEDIVRYRAAAIAVNVFGETFGKSILARKTAHHSLVSFAEFLQLGSDEIQSVCDPLQNWRRLFSYNGKTYPNLNRTLDHLPGGVSGNLLPNLAQHRLGRVFNDRVELIVTLLAEGCNFRHNRHVFQFATRAEIVEAMNKVSTALQRPLSHRHTAHLDTFVRFLSDYPDPHRGSILGLANKAIAFHEEIASNACFPRSEHLGDSEMARPPIPIPSTPGLRFLDTSEAIYNESVLMGHCIASYIEPARQGQCFLFHYDHANESASIEVSAHGYVTQSYGPRNSDNAAARRARVLLAKWANNFPTPVKKPKDRPIADETPF